MPRFIGSKFGDFVGVNTVNGFADSGVYDYNDQIFLKEAGAWQGFSASGGLESTPGNGYKYHTFLSSGSFTVAGTVHPTGMEVLVVAGGGGGGKVTSTFKSKFLGLEPVISCVKGRIRSNKMEIETPPKRPTTSPFLFDSILNTFPIQIPKEDQPINLYF